LIAAMLMLIPLWYNGTPLYYPDSMGYIFWGQLWEPVPERLSTYAVLIKFLSLGRDLWIPVLFQSLMAVWVLKRLWHRLLGEVHPPAFWLASALLGVLSPLGWTAATLMPDLLCALSSIFLFLMLYPGEGKKPAFTDLFLFAFCTSQHLSALMINGSLLLLYMPFFLWKKEIPTRLPGLRMGFLGLVLSCLMIVSVNRMLSGRFFLSESGPAFLTARLIETGIASRFLGQHPAKSSDFQAVKNQFPMPAERFLWANSSPIKQLGGIHDDAGKLAAFNWAALSQPYNIYLFLKAGFKSGMKQFFLLDIGDGLGPASFPQLYFFPENQAEHLTSKQKSGIDFEKLNNWCYALCGLVLLIAITGLRQESPTLPMKNMAVFILFLLFMNALINGALSTPLSRYQVRVSWLVYFWLIAFNVRFIQIKLPSNFDFSR
jgi:hypothetical protein